MGRAFFKAIAELLIETNPKLAKYRLLILGISASAGVMLGSDVETFLQGVCK